MTAGGPSRFDENAKEMPIHPATSRNGNMMRLISWNTAHKTHKRTDQVKALLARSPDLVALQEILKGDVSKNSGFNLHEANAPNSGTWSTASSWPAAARHAIGKMKWELEPDQPRPSQPAGSRASRNHIRHVLRMSLAITALCGRW